MLKKIWQKIQFLIRLIERPDDLLIYIFDERRQAL